MQVFKLCLKIIKKNILMLLVYVIIFVVISVLMSSTLAETWEKAVSFTQAKSDIAFISEESSPLIDGLKTELGKIASFVEVPDKTEELQDALFFRKVSYILRVPEGFTESFMKGENPQLEKTVVPDSATNTYIDLCIDKYFNTARLYVQYMDGVTQESLVQHLNSDFSANASVELKTFGGRSADHSYANYFFNYLAYTLLTILVLGMTALMLVYNDKDLRMRNACSPISANSFNMQFMLANLMFAFVTWLIMVSICLLFNMDNSFNMNTVYFVINSFIFSICGTGISFLIGNLARNQETASAICNVVTLGFCFISGVFVPQKFLGDFVLKIASFTPTYWFVKANDRIAELAKFDFSHVAPVLSDMSVQLGFALAFFAVALVIGKKKQFESQ